MQFEAGQHIQFLSSETASWELARYVAKRLDGRHICEKPNKRQVTLADKHIRPVPPEGCLSGFIAIYRQNDGHFTIIGPRPTEGELNKLMEDYKAIWPNGPEAIIDMSAHNITFKKGDGIDSITQLKTKPFNRMTKGNIL